VNRVVPGAALLAAAVATAAAQQATFTGGIDLVTIGVAVTDRGGRLVTGLPAEAFEIFEDGRKQAVRLFAAGTENLPETALHLGMLLDVSESMDRDLPFVRSASIKLVTLLDEVEDVTIVDFDSEVRAARFAPRDPRLVERIRMQKVGGWTSLFDAVGVYLDGASVQDGRKVMLLYTDGGDTRSRLDLAGLLDLLKASDITAYVIGALEHRTASARAQQRTTLLRIAEATGGLAFFPMSAAELDEIYAKVLADIRGRYTLGFVSTNERTDGTWRNVEVRLPGPDARAYKIRARKGYFALLK
jgi:Ca-activated chloride channel family protein